jgi:protein-disulfide isomerase
MNTTIFLALCAAGFVVSVLSALETHVHWIDRLCAFFGEGCRRTAEFTLLGAPVSLWGMAFYLLLPAMLIAYDPLVFWLVAAGVGFELTFVRIMIFIRAFCIFCVANAAVVIGLAVTAFDPSRVWTGIVLAVAALAVSSVLLKRENTEEMETQDESTASGVPSDCIERCPASGPTDAPVTVLEFSDYLCPACRKAHETVKQVREKYRDRVRWVFMDFPLGMHEGSRELAAAARCAADQDRFWEFQDTAFSVNGTPDEEELRRYARDLGMDADRFMKCIENGEHLARIEDSLQAGKAVGVSATPTFFINGRKHRGAPSAGELENIIEDELDKSRDG